MKPALFTCFWILLFYHQSNGQLKVDAGNDVIVCASYNEEYKDIKLGGCPAASGGVEPYSYTWSGKLNVYPKANIWVFASDVLEDTIKSNPALRSNPPENWMTLYLTVKDAENNIGIDSVKIRCSYFIINLTGPIHETIKRGDSVAFHGDYLFNSNFKPFEYYITPSYGLNDSTNVLGWAKPDTSVLYYLYVVNPAGCVSKKVQYLFVEVDTVNTSISNVNYSSNECFFSNGQLMLKLNKEFNSSYILTVSTINGVLIYSGKYNSRNLRLSNLNIKKHQIYIVTVTDLNKKTVFKLANN
jgi:hypothetical protein